MSHPKKPVLEQQCEPFWLENQQGFSQAFWDVGCFYSFTTSLCKGGSNSNQVVGSPFCHLAHFLSLTALMIQFIKLINWVLSQYALLTNRFIFC
jgi:hypothetical protein